MNKKRLQELAGLNGFDYGYNKPVSDPIAPGAYSSYANINQKESTIDYSVKIVCPYKSFCNGVCKQIDLYNLGYVTEISAIDEDEYMSSYEITMKPHVDKGRILDILAGLYGDSIVVTIEESEEE
jgi:hypothetical protein